MWLARGARLFEETAPMRASLALFAVLSAAALGLADFGAYRRIGWAIKAAGVGLLGIVLAGVLRGSPRPPLR